MPKAKQKSKRTTVDQAGSSRPRRPEPLVQAPQPNPGVEQRGPGPSAKYVETDELVMKLFFVTVLLISMVVGTLAIDCYSCAGGTCGDPFFPIISGGSDTCSVFTNYCRKRVTGSTVTRSCQVFCIEGCIGGRCDYCCSSNLCNGGTTMTTSFVAMGVAMLAAFILTGQ